MRNPSTPARKHFPLRTHRGSLTRQPDEQINGNNGDISRGKKEEKNSITCLAIEESQKNKIMMKMSPESIRIISETKWSEKGFIPSFNYTDTVLRKASRRTYKTLGISDR